MSEKPFKVPEKVECVQDRLTEIDVKLLRQLTINAKTSNVELARKLQTSKLILLAIFRS